MTTFPARKNTEVHRQPGFSTMEKWVLAALATLPLSSLLLITDVLNDLTNHWL